jgi:hypothetical protein
LKIKFLLFIKCKAIKITTIYPTKLLYIILNILFIHRADYAGENFVRFSGDTRKHARAQLFAWEAYGKGVDVHLLAEPTKLELLQKEYEGRKEDYKTEAQASVLAKYGGEEHLQAPPKALLLAQTENYVEYSRHGRVIKVQYRHSDILSTKIMRSGRYNLECNEISKAGPSSLISIF